MKRLILTSGRSRFLTALLAVTVIAAGGSIAWAAIPDSSGVIHGCYKTVGGTLRVINTDAGSKCVASETPLNWNQIGPTGARGQTGPTGPQGPGATTFTTTLSHDNTFHALATLANGVAVSGRCSTGVVGVDIQLKVSTGANLQMSGTVNEDTAVAATDVNGSLAEQFGGDESADVDVLARDKTVGKFARIDGHGSNLGIADPCPFWGMIIPSG